MSWLRTRRLLLGLALGMVAELWAGLPVRAQAPAPAPAAVRPTRKLKGLWFVVRWRGQPLGRKVSGRVYVMTAPMGVLREPRLGPNWFRPAPFFAKDFQDWDGAAPLKLGSDCDGFPGPISSLRRGLFQVQGVVRINRDSHRIGDAPGNLYGPVLELELDPEDGGEVGVPVDQIAPERPFENTERVRLAELESPMLSRFFGRPIKHRAAVILPQGFQPGPNAPKRPTLYIIPGFGGDHFMAHAFLSTDRLDFGKDLIRVVLDPDCGTGHHVFADSACNGPRGRALVEEFIPYLEKTWPLIPEPRARLLTGHSSGGWSSLWLQVSHADFFGGVWSTAPDPVDFRDFQQINIYAPGENMFRDHEGRPRPIARRDQEPVLFYEPFSRMDDVIGWGGQLGSFEAVFSPLDSAGKPRKLWNRQTGAIDPETAKSWEAYDLHLVLARNWKTLGPKLKGKLHVYTGELDTFYLEGAVKKLKEALMELGSDAQIEIVPGRDHGNLLDADMARKLDQSMTQTLGSLAPQPTN